MTAPGPHERHLRNKALWSYYNERTEREQAIRADTGFRFFCECPQPSCRETVILPLEHYLARYGRREQVLALDHDLPAAAHATPMGASPAR